MYYKYVLRKQMEIGYEPIPNSSMYYDTKYNIIPTTHVDERKYR